MKRGKYLITWKKFHRWAGLFVAVFILVFGVSGIILNHRSCFKSCDVSRSLLPQSYHIKDYNNGIIRGTIPLGADSLLAFGSCGVWLTNTSFNTLSEYNQGFPKGVDNRNIKNIVKTSDGNIWCASQYELYKLLNNTWKKIKLPCNDERISDVALSKDKKGILVIGRSNIYEVSDKTLPKKLELLAPENASNKVSLFKTIWLLHSGELFGTVGKIIVDLTGIILIILSITGIVIFILPYSIRTKIKRGHKVPMTIKIFKWNFRWHNLIGVYTFVVTLLIAITGTCLRPPLMIPFVLSKTSPVPGSSLDNGNFWYDKLRALRWDKMNNEWLLSSSEGFYRFASFNDKPKAIPKDKAPQVSPMGVNVFREEAPGVWIVGSFSGIFRWDTSNGVCYDFYTGEKIENNRRSLGLANNLVCGYSADTSSPIVFDYAKGTGNLPKMEDSLRKQPMSLWNVALELHVGRCYSPFLGPISDMFVFLFGLLISLILISGYILSRKHKN